MQARFLITGMLFVVLVLGSANLVDGRTFALYADAQNVDDNVFSAGEIDLRLTDADETQTTDATATWGPASLKPGETVTGALHVTNLGSVSAHHLEIRTSNAVTPSSTWPGNVETVPIDTVLELHSLTYDGASQLSHVPDDNGNGMRDLDDLENVVIDDLPLADLNVSHEVAITFGLAQSALTQLEHHGDTVSTTLTLTLNQDASQ